MISPSSALLELAARHLDVLVDAHDVGELQPHKVDAEALGELEHVLLPAPSGRSGSRRGWAVRPSRSTAAWRAPCLPVPCRVGTWEGRAMTAERNPGSAWGKAPGVLSRLPHRFTLLPP